MRKLLICTQLGVFSTFHCMLYIYLSGYNTRTIQDIEFKFSGFLLFAEATNWLGLGTQVLKLTFSG